MTLGVSMWQCRTVSYNITGRVETDSIRSRNPVGRSLGTRPVSGSKPTHPSVLVVPCSHDLHGVYLAVIERVAGSMLVDCQSSWPVLTVLCSAET